MRLSVPEPLEYDPDAYPPGSPGAVLADWVRDYVSRHPPYFRRSGPLCPFARRSHQKGEIFWAVAPAVTSVIDVARVVATYDAWFYRTIDSLSPCSLLAVAFPDLPDEQRPWLFAVHNRAADERADRGAIGALFWEAPGADEATSWPHAFRCPFPIYTLRLLHGADSTPGLPDDLRTHQGST